MKNSKPDPKPPRWQDSFKNALPDRHVLAAHPWLKPVRYEGARQDSRLPGSLTDEEFHANPRQTFTPNDDGSLDSDRVLEMAMEQAGLRANIEFRHWQDRHHFTLSTAADVLGLTRRTVSQYRTGSRPIPKVVGLACRAIDMGAHA